MEGVNTKNTVHAFGKRTRTQHLANAQVKVLYLFLYPPSKKPLFFVFSVWEIKVRGVRVKLGGVNCGEFALGVQLEGIDFDTLRGGRNCLGVASG